MGAAQAARVRWAPVGFGLGIFPENLSSGVWQKHQGITTGLLTCKCSWNTIDAEARLMVCLRFVLINVY